MFSLTAQIEKEIQDFGKDIQIAAINKAELSLRSFLRKSRPYTFHQLNTLNLIDLYYNSKFETGEWDTENQRKLFLNICAFRSDVASKMIDLDVKDFVFIPEEASDEWGAYLLSKDFKLWAKKNYFGELINEVVETLPKYGTCVLKKVGDKLERVPLKNLINPQDAKDLKKARFVIEIHPDMRLEEIKGMKDWNLTNLRMEYDDKVTVYERYGFVPVSTLKEHRGEKPKEEDYKNTVDVMSIVAMQEVEQQGKKQKIYNTLFMEKAKRPYEEVHWKKQDGRWLGIGEVENLFENQIAQNTIANLRRRSLLWSSKHVFQSSDDTVAKNLIKEVKDGDVLRIAPNGNITQVDMTTRSAAEFSVAENYWENNSDKKSFTYEVTTGESLPSGTPFRLGVLMSNAANSHFDLKKEKVGLFLKRVFVELLIPIFKSDTNDQHFLLVPNSDDEFEAIKEINIEANFRKMLFKHLEDNVFLPTNIFAMRDDIRAKLEKGDKVFVDIPSAYYDDIKFRVEIEITGEALNLPKKLETLTNLFTALSQKGDPRADKILEKIGILTGEKVPKAPPATAPPLPVSPFQQQSQIPQLAGKEQPTL